MNLTADGLLDVLRLSLRVKIDAVRATAHSGHATYQGLLDHGSDLLLVCDLEGLDEVWPGPAGRDVSSMFN